LALPPCVAKVCGQGAFGPRVRARTTEISVRLGVAGGPTGVGPIPGGPLALTGGLSTPPPGPAREGPSDFPARLFSERCLRNRGTKNPSGSGGWPSQISGFGTSVIPLVAVRALVSFPIAALAALHRPSRNRSRNRLTAFWQTGGPGLGRAAFSRPRT